MEMYPGYTFAVGQSEAGIAKSVTGIKHSENGDVLCRHTVTHGAYVCG